MATAASSMHPTGMHSFYYLVSTYSLIWGSMRFGDRVMGSP